VARGIRAIIERELDEGIVLEGSLFQRQMAALTANKRKRSFTFLESKLRRKEGFHYFFFHNVLIEGSEMSSDGCRMVVIRIFSWRGMVVVWVSGLRKIDPES
jgi:hypothetical protein